MKTKSLELRTPDGDYVGTFRGIGSFSSYLYRYDELLTLLRPDGSYMAGIWIKKARVVSRWLVVAELRPESWEKRLEEVLR